MNLETTKLHVFVTHYPNNFKIIKAFMIVFFFSESDFVGRPDGKSVLINSLNSITGLETFLFSSSK